MKKIFNKDLSDHHVMETVYDNILFVLGWIIGNPGQDFGFGGDACHGAALAWAERRVITIGCSKATIDFVLADESHTTLNR